MNTISVDVESLKGSNVIEIGLRGETDVTEVVFDVSSLVETYGDGTVTLLAKRNGDADAYPIIVTRTDNEVIWTVNDTDTAVCGFGSCELWYYVGDALAKTIVYKTFVGEDIGSESATPPDPYAGWVTQMVEIGNQASEDADKVEEAVSHYPSIIDDYWYVWDVLEEEYVNSGVRARADVSFADSGVIINT